MTAPLVTLGAIGAGVAIAGPATKASFGEITVARTSMGQSSGSLLHGREASISRNFNRMAIAGASNVKPPVATGKLWTTAPLDVRLTPTEDARTVGVIKELSHVAVTGVRHDGYAEIVVKKRSRWVTAEYLAKKKPKPAVAGVGGSCTNGTSVPSGVSPNIVKVHRAVCAAFPQISSYGTFRGDGEHSQGLAIDIMVSGGLGWEVAEFVRARYQELGVSYAIYSQKIWSVERGGEGWRGMSDRGSTTANHYDHVHVTTY